MSKIISFACKISNMLSSKWAILFSVFIGILLQFTSKNIISNAWALSLFVKSAIMTGLPFLMFAILASGLLQIRQNGNKIILALLVLTFAINISTFLFLFPIGKFTDIFVANKSSITSLSMTVFEPAWNITLPIILRNDVAVILGFVFWIVCKNFCADSILPFAKKMSETAFFTLGKIFGPAVYLFIIGFIANLNFSEFVMPMIKTNYPILFIVLFSQMIFIYIVIGLSHGFRKAFRDIYNLFPAMTIGFTTMSSGMAFPKTCAGLQESGIPNNVVCVMPSILMPATVADGFMISALIFFISSLFGLDSISFYTFFVGSIYYALFKFSSCCMPGGTIMCVLPIMTSQFGFNNEMCVLIASMCLVFDSFVTAGNVLGHGAFGIVFNKLFGKLMK